MCFVRSAASDCLLIPSDLATAPIPRGNGRKGSSENVSFASMQAWYLSVCRCSGFGAVLLRVLCNGWGSGCCTAALLTPIASNQAATWIDGVSPCAASQAEKSCGVPGPFPASNSRFSSRKIARCALFSWSDERGKLPIKKGDRPGLSTLTGVKRRGRCNAAS